MPIIISSDGNTIYGTMVTNDSTGAGFLYSLTLNTTPVTFKTLFTFPNNNMSYPIGSLAIDNNILYGVTINRNIPNRYGSLYAYSLINNNITILYNFTLAYQQPLNLYLNNNILYIATTNENSTTPFIGTISSYTLDPSCFNQNTQILCLDNNLEEKYMSIKKIKKGTLVKTYKHGYRKIDLIGKKIMKNDPSSLLNCMYRLKNEDQTMPDLIVTGLHSICVDKLSDKEIEACKKHNFKLSNIDDKYLLPACISDKFEKINNRNIYTYYHLTLEHENNENAQYAIMANGILTETTCENNFIRIGFNLTN
jgi:hypothetical protein